jgi:DNA-binding SARP family transcriptional activator
MADVLPAPGETTSPRPPLEEPPGDVVVRVLGQFSVTTGSRAAGPWQRPSARRLCELVLVSADRRISRELAREALFPDLEPQAASRALSKALSMARASLAELGEPGASLLSADLTHIWAAPDAVVDAAAQAAALRAARHADRGGRGPGRPGDVGVRARAAGDVRRAARARG